MITDVVILAGGFGERLWPASSPAFPKQFMALNGGVSFLQESIARALSLGIPGRIVIVTRRDIEAECVSQCLALAARASEEQYEKILNGTVVLSEPCAKHTAAALMTAIAFLHKQSGGAEHTVLVLTSDHAIFPEAAFGDDCRRAAQEAERGTFVCFAIPPAEPATGYGYIQAGADVHGDGTVFAIDRFAEKPDATTARAYLAQGNWWWNSGMFAFCSSFFVAEMERLTPEVHDAFRHVLGGQAPSVKKSRGITVIDRWPELEMTYACVPAVAVDKAIAEKTRNAVAVKASFSWTDVGSWDTFCALCTAPDNAPVADVGGGNNFVYADRPVALCGVSDLIVVARNDQVLVLKKGSSALVRDAVRRLQEPQGQ